LTPENFFKRTGDDGFCDAWPTNDVRGDASEIHDDDGPFLPSLPARTQKDSGQMPAIR
jgi:hypothetical protein